jgi:4-amino-4-deoxy-L-arabinose transferase-like glycosyltransferase
MPRLDLALAAFLGLVTVASRLPYRATLLTSWDAVQFALALGEFDVVKHQPHPPGYLLYVALARLAAAVTGDATAALTGLAVGASGVAVVLVYRLAWQLYGRATAVVAALGLAASPLFWAYGEVGLPYTTEAALATVVALTVWPMRQGGTAFASWSALALALAGGVRQSLLVVLLPLWLGMAWLGFRRPGPVLRGLGVLAVVTLAWLVPMVWLSGGPGRYLAAGGELYGSTVRATTVLGPPGGWWINVVGLGEGSVLAFGVLLVPVAAGLAWALGRPARWDARAVFFAAWIAPPLAVYALVHFGQYGYLLTVLPAAYVLLARALVCAVERLRALGVRWAVATAVVAVTVAAHAALFTRAPAIEIPGLLAATPGAQGWWMSLQARYRYRLWPLTAPGLRDHEAIITAFVDGVRQRFRPGDTVLLTELGNPRSYPWFRHVGYYLPEFVVYHLRVGSFSPGYLASRPLEGMAAFGGPEIVLPRRTLRLVWVVDHWNPAVPPPSGLVAHALPRGRWLYSLDVDGRPVEHAGYRLTPLTSVARLR